MTPEQVKKRLEVNYPNSVIEVVDMTGTENHYEVFIESKRFAGLSRMEQHQQVMAVFSPELKTEEVHALSIRTKTKE